MSTKRAPRKRKESDITDQFKPDYKKNFDCSNITLKKQFPLTDNQTAFYYLTQNEKTNMIFLDGPAGSAKSYCAVYSGIEMLKSRQVDKIVYIRSVVESSSKSLGSLPGEIDEKFGPYAAVCIEKAMEIVDKPTLNALLEQEYIKTIPVNFVRGLTFNNSFVIIDEAQNLTKGELVTILTRFGRHSKYLILGDSKQCDITASGFNTVFEKFDTDFSRKNHIHTMNFDVSDIVRSPILKHITQVLGV